MISRLQTHASDFRGENQVAAINFRGVVKEIHNHFNLVESVSEIFTWQYFNAVVVYLCLQFEECMSDVSNIEDAKMDSWIAATQLHCLLPLLTIRESAGSPGE